MLCTMHSTLCTNTEADNRARTMLNTKAVRLAELLGKEPLDADELHVQLGNMLVA